MEGLDRVAIILLMLLSFEGFGGTVGAEEKRLIVRGDDFGMTQGSLAAFERAFNDGILTSGSLIVPSPWFAGAAELYRKNPNWCIGVHLALVGEWRGYRWRPVLPYDRVPSLVDRNGFFYQSPRELFSHKPKIEEIDAELRAQVDLAIREGVCVQYLDTHYMSPNSYPGLAETIKKISRDYNLPMSGSVGEKPLRGVYHVPAEEKLGVALKILEKLQPGLWLWVFHVGIRSPEQDALVHSDPKDVFVGEGVGLHRAAELEVVTSPEVKSLISKRNVKLVSYSDFVKGSTGETKRKSR